MFKDKEVFDSYRNKYLRCLDYLVDQYEVQIQIVKSSETDLVNLLDIVEKSKQLKGEKKHKNKMSKYFQVA